MSSGQGGGPMEEELGDVTAPPPTKTKDSPEQARRWIVYALVFIIALTVAAPFILLIFGFSLTEKHWEYLHIVFPAEIGLLTAAMAFYFDRRN